MSINADRLISLFYCEWSSGFRIVSSNIRRMILLLTYRIVFQNTHQRTGPLVISMTKLMPTRVNNLNIFKLPTCLNPICILVGYCQHIYEHKGTTRAFVFLHQLSKCRMCSHHSPGLADRVREAFSAVDCWGRVIAWVTTWNGEPKDTDRQGTTGYHQRDFIYDFKLIVHSMVGHKSFRILDRLFSRLAWSRTVVIWPGDRTKMYMSLLQSLHDCWGEH